MDEHTEELLEQILDLSVPPLYVREDYLFHALLVRLDGINALASKALELSSNQLVKRKVI